MYAWIANVGVAKIASVSAPDDFSFAICDETSGAVGSYGCAAITFAFDRWRPRLSPPSRSLP